MPGVDGSVVLCIFKRWLLVRTLCLTEWMSLTVSAKGDNSSHSPSGSLVFSLLEQGWIWKIIVLLYRVQDVHTTSTAIGQKFQLTSSFSSANRDKRGWDVFSQNHWASKCAPPFLPDILPVLPQFRSVQDGSYVHGENPYVLHFYFILFFMFFSTAFQTVPGLPLPDPKTSDKDHGMMHVACDCQELLWWWWWWWVDA